MSLQNTQAGLLLFFGKCTADTTNAKGLCSLRTGHSLRGIDYYDDLFGILSFYFKFIISLWKKISIEQRLEIKEALDIYPRFIFNEFFLICDLILYVYNIEWFTVQY